MTGIKKKIKDENGHDDRGVESIPPCQRAPLPEPFPVNDPPQQEVYHESTDRRYRRTLVDKYHPSRAQHGYVQRVAVDVLYFCAKEVDNDCGRDQSTERNHDDQGRGACPTDPTTPESD